MKRSLLLLLLCSFAAFAQNSNELLVRWEGTRINWGTPTTKPMYYNTTSPSLTANSSMTAADASGNGISFAQAEQYTGFKGLNWPTSASSVDYDKYYQFAITAGAGKQIELKHFMFRYSGYCDKINVLYAKSSTGAPANSSFSSAASLASINNATSSQNSNIASAFPSGYTLLAGETLYVRIYGYKVDQYNNNMFILHNSQTNNVANSSSYGPAIYGVISAADGVSAVADSASTPESTAVNINVTGNDSATGTSIASVSIAQQSSNGVAAVQSDNTITFTPNSGYTGTTNFQYKITGADATTSTATVTVTVNPFASPVANADSATTGQNIPVTVNVLANDTQGDGTINTVQILSGPANGTATVNASKQIVYTPSASFTGTTNITYKITDSNNKTATATLTISVVAVQAAVAENDTAATPKNNAITLNVISNDNPGNSAIVAVAITGNPSHGTVVVNGDLTVTYDPQNGFSGTDSFVYTITTAYGSTSSATVNMSVLQPNATGSLCGEYKIGVGPQNDFTTITQAVNHLNTYGVVCPVTFILSDNLYNNASGEVFPITINTFTGSTVVNTVTFKPGVDVNARIEAFRDATVGSYTGVPAVFKINGADNIVFDGSNKINDTTRNLWIVNSSFAGGEDHSNDYTDRAVMWVAANGTDGAQNITIKYAQIKQTYKNSSDNYCVGIYSGGNGTQGNNELAVTVPSGQNNTLNVIGNDFVNVKQGLYVNGASAGITNVTVHQNDLGAENNTESVILPITLNNVNGFTVSENLIYKLFRNTTAADFVAGGINITGSSRNGSIVKNNLRDLVRNTTDGNTFAGIVLSSTYAGSNITVANNFILDVSAQGNSGGYSNGYGIIANQGSGYKIYHNTVVLTVNQPLGGYSAAFYVNSGVTGLDVRNNIFVNNQTNASTRRSAIMVNNDVDNLNQVFSYLDYNNYYSTDRIGYIANQHDLNITWPDNPDFVQTFDGWRAALNNTNNSANANNKDSHSLNVNPVFLSATDLHLSNDNTAINNAGTPVAAVTKDIDSQVRHTATPDMGADEFGAIQMPSAGSSNGIYCDSAVTWNGTEWIGGLPSADTDVIFAGPYAQSGGTFYACSIFVVDGAAVSFGSHSNAIVTHAVNVEEGSTLTFESSSNLVQIENAQNTGTVTVKRNSSKLKRLDYTCWSSPVTGTQSLFDFSPLTVANRFYNLNSSTNLFNSYADPDAVLWEKGNGYLIRVPNNFPTNVPTIFNGEFVGTPNNGTIKVAMQYYGDNSYKMVGNPYPSPINIRKFIDANLNNIEGTIWVWRKTNDPTKSTYATLNKTGYTANSAPGGGSGNDNSGNDLIVDPFDIATDGVLNTGQGFFVNALGNLDLVFKNNMREAIAYDNFFRTEQTEEESLEESLYSRYWLNVETEDESVFSQMLVGYSPLTSKEYDNGYDGRNFGGGVTLYSIIPNGESTRSLSIQSRDAFSVIDTIQVGFKTEVAGSFTIKLDHMDGLFAAGQQIYLVDKLMDVTHNIVSGDYSFTSETGTFDDRFEVIYTMEALGTDTHVLPENEVIAYTNSGELYIDAPTTITDVKVYDLTGKMVYSNAKVDTQNFAAAVLLKQQVGVVVITLDNNQVVTKKMMMN